MVVIFYGLWILVMVSLYFLALGGWRDVLDFLDELGERRERKESKKQ